MGWQYYVFALFIFALLCVFALVCYRLYNKSGKKQTELLDEKEAKLLNLYRSIEVALEEFYEAAGKSLDEVEAKMEELRAVQSIRLPSHNARLLMREQSSKPAQSAQASPYARAYEAQNGAAGETPPSFQTALEKADMAPGTANAQESAKAEPFAPGQTPSEHAADGKVSKAGRILALKEEGMERTEIAQELNITLSEVDLVIGMAQ